MLKEEDEDSVDESSEDDNVVEIENSVEVDEDGQGNSKDVDEEGISDSENSQEDEMGVSESEVVAGDESSEETVSNTQNVKRQENVAEVLDIVDKNPRITLWSSRSAAVFRYLRKTEPEFSISREASILIDEAVSKKYPEIWDLFEELK